MYIITLDLVLQLSLFSTVTRIIIGSDMDFNKANPYTEYAVYTILITTIFLVISWIVIKIRYKFWATQPIFHTYDLKYYILPPGIIKTSIPEKTKFFHPDIEFNEIDGSNNLPRFCTFIRQHYMRNGANKYFPEASHIMSYFSGHTQKCYVSVLNSTESLVVEKSQKVLMRPIVIACMTSRPMICNFEDLQGNRETFACNYVDYLCVDDKKRGEGLASKIIYTHEYYVQRRKGMPIISVFKREGTLSGIVPICSYQMEGFDMCAWRPMPPLPANRGKISLCTPETLYLAMDFMRRRAKTDFEMYLGVGDGNISKLLSTGNIYLYLYINEYGNITSIYFFRHTCTWLSDQEEILSCFASIRGDTNNKMFIHAFKSAVTHLVRSHKKQHRYTMLVMENITNNDILIESLKERTTPSLREPASYFFYNFAYKSFPANKCLIIN